jgi:hypothetical protein
MVLVIAAAAVVWRPWEQLRPPGAVGPQFEHARQATVIVVNRTGGPCKVRIAGTSGGAITSLVTVMPAGVDRRELTVSGAFAVDSISVDRDGKNHHYDRSVEIGTGKKCEITIGPGDDVTVSPPAP